MDIYEYKRAVRMLGDVSMDDQAVVISRMKQDGTVVTVNCGDGEARKRIYDVLLVLPPTAPRVQTTQHEEGGAE